MAPQLLTRKEAARYLALSSSSFDRLARAQAFPTVRLGHVVRYLASDLDAYVEACRT